MKHPAVAPHSPQTRLLSTGPVIDYSFKEISALSGGGPNADMPACIQSFSAALMTQLCIVGLEAVQPCSGRPRQLACTWARAKAPDATAPPSDATKAPGPVQQASMVQNIGRLQTEQEGSQVVQAVPAVVAAAPESSSPALNSNAVRLSYNPLPTLAGLPAAMAKILDDPVSPSRLEALAGI